MHKTRFVSALVFLHSLEIKGCANIAFPDPALSSYYTTTMHGRSTQPIKRDVLVLTSISSYVRVYMCTVDIRRCVQIYLNQLIQYCFSWPPLALTSAAHSQSIRLGSSISLVSFSIILSFFLIPAEMRVKVAQELSRTRQVNRGARQGSCAGVQMDTVGTDDIDDGIAEPEPLRGSPAHNPDWSHSEHRPA